MLVGDCKNTIMSINKKLKASPAGRPVFQVTRLKALWRTLTEDQRAGWSAFLVSETSQAEIRRQILARFKINLRYDRQLLRFRTWLDELEALKAGADRAAADEVELRQQGLAGAQLREELLNRMKIRALARGDFKLGLRAIAADVKMEVLELDREKFKVGLHTKIQAGLESILAEARGNPAIAEAVKQIQQATV
jgi:hypothetical protein